MSRRLERSWETYQAREARVRPGAAKSEPTTQSSGPVRVAVKITPPVLTADGTVSVKTAQPSPPPTDDTVQVKKPVPVAQTEPSAVEPTVPKPKAPRGRRLRRKLIGFSFAALVLMIGVMAVVNWSSQPTSSPDVLSAKTSQTVEEMAEITTDEQPVILLVTDKSKVQQEFLSKAENGDQVMVYYQARKAVLYRPSEKRVIATGDFTPPPAKVFLRAGKSATRRLADTEAEIKKLPGLNLISQDKSTNSYTQTIVVDITKRYAREVEQLASALKARVETLPAGEASPDADILVIAGAQ